MIYLDSRGISELGADWQELTDVIAQTIDLVGTGDFAQPIKPYLRYRNPSNRIIAMPAFVGGSVAVAGLKWIASFPGNAAKNLPRAHSVTILNEADTGRPIGIINTARVSELRTAAVSGFVVDRFLCDRTVQRPLIVGIIGLGPVGRAHLEMMLGLFGERIEELRVYDAAGSTLYERALSGNSRAVPCGSWFEAYEGADILVTATVATRRYIDRPPKPGSLHLNISLRDYLPSVGRSFGLVAVDSWEEVCRENTDVEVMYKETELQRADTRDLVDIRSGNAFPSLAPDQAVLFNPMGMAVFDVAIGAAYLRLALARGCGVRLAD